MLTLPSILIVNGWVPVLQELISKLGFQTVEKSVKKHITDMLLVSTTSTNKYSGLYVFELFLKVILDFDSLR
jgi:hypothetical protein